MKKLCCLIAVLGFIMIFTVPVAFCQDLDGLWFKTTVSGKGYVDDSANYAVGGKAAAKVVNYVQFVYNSAWSTACPGQFYPFYEIHLWYPVGSGWDYEIYQGYNTFQSETYGLYGSPYYATIFLDKQFVMWAGYWNWLPFQGRDFWADATMVIDIKRSSGSIKSATFNSATCSSEFLTPSGWAYGPCAIKGKLLQPEKLPAGLLAAGAGTQYTAGDTCAP
jgi:hypothetical protein